jgi:hypothetical protein
MSALIEAEQLVMPRDRVTLERRDHDGDLREELIFEGPEIDLYLSPSRGGSGLQIDLKRSGHHLTGVLARRLEAYHADVARAQVVSDEELGNISAHDLVRATESDLASKLLFDAYPRGAFVDHLLPPDAGPEMLDHGYAPLADLANATYQVVEAAEQGRGAGAVLSRTDGDFRLLKTVRLEGDEMEVSYRLGATGPRRGLRFASQIDVTLHSPDRAGGRRIEVSDAGRHEHDLSPGARAVAHGVERVRVVGESMGVDVSLEPSPQAQLWRLPIETVSQSERGFERAYQGTSLLFVWDAEIGGGKDLAVSLRLTSR